MAKRPVYSDEIKASAIAFMDAAGYPDTPGASERVSERFGIPRRTLERWYKGERRRPPDHLVHGKKAELADLFRAEIAAAFKEMNEARPGASYRDLATAVGILTDKLQLLTGEPTENSNTRIVIEYADVEIDAATPAQGPADGD